MAFGAKPQTVIKPQHYAACTRYMAHIFNQRGFELHGLFNGLTPVNSVRESTHWLGLATKHGQTVCLFGGDKFNLLKQSFPHFITPDGYSYHIEAVVDKRRQMLDCVETGYSSQFETILNDPELSNRERETQLCDVAANAAQEITTLMRNNLKPLRSLRAKVVPGKGKGGRLLVVIPKGTSLGGYARKEMKRHLNAVWQKANDKIGQIAGWVVNADLDAENVRRFFAQTEGIPSDIQTEEPAIESLGFLDSPSKSASAESSLGLAPVSGNGVPRQSEPVTPALASGNDNDAARPQAAASHPEQSNQTSEETPLPRGFVLSREDVINPDGIVIG